MESFFFCEALVLVEYVVGEVDFFEFEEVDLSEVDDDVLVLLDADFELAVGEGCYLFE